MSIEGFEIRKPKLKQKDTGDSLSKAVEKHTMHKETFEEAWERVLGMKNTDTVQEQLLIVMNEMKEGKIGRRPDKVNKKFSKSEALEYYKDIQQREIDALLKEMVENIPENYHLVQTDQALNRVVDILKEEEEIVFDVETTGTDVDKDYLVGHVLSSVKKDLHFYIPVKHKTADKQLDADYVIETLKPIYEDDSILKIAHNYKFDFKMLAKEGVEVRGDVWDTQEAMKLLNENEMTYALKPLVEKYLKIPSKTYGQLFGQVGFDTIDLKTALAYASKDGEVTYLLKEFQIEHLKKMPKLYKYVTEVEMPMIRIVAEMEQVGYELNSEFAEEYTETLRKEVEESLSKVMEALDYSNEAFVAVGDIIEIEGYVGEVTKLNGNEISIKKNGKGQGTFKGYVEEIEEVIAKNREPLNLNSPAQLKEAIERYIGRKIENTNADQTLKPLAKEFPIIKELLTYRGKSRLLSTYFEALPRLINPNTGRIHTQFNQNGALTGRFSAGGGDTFNIQNIPPEARPMFVAPKGYYIVGADFSAQEVRIIASESQEKVLLDAFKEGKDPYATLASKFFNKPYEECYKLPDGSDTEERKMMKVVLLSSMYGASKYGLSGSLSISVDEAEKFRQNFFNTYKNIDRFIKNTQQFVRRTGFVWIGDEERKRRLPMARTNNPMYGGEKSRALRQAPNAVIQGRASIQTKRTMIELDRVSKERGWILYYTIHDEVAVLMPEDFTREDIDIFDKIMTQTYLLNGVDNKADIEIQKSWSNSMMPEEYFKGA